MRAEDDSGKGSKRANDLGPTGRRVQENLRKLRESEPGLSTYRLSERLERLGRKITPGGITSIETGERPRRVDVDDLVALALALGVNPDRLLLPADDSNDDVALTSTVTVGRREAWSWARGSEPLFEADAVIHGEEAAAERLRTAMARDPLDQGVSEFQRRVSPPQEIRVTHHSAMQAALRVELLIELVVTGQQARDQSRGSLNRALDRLRLEIEDLIGDDDGER